MIEIKETNDRVYAIDNDLEKEIVAVYVKTECDCGGIGYEIMRTGGYIPEGLVYFCSTCKKVFWKEEVFEENCARPVCSHVVQKHELENTDTTAKLDFYKSITLIYELKEEINILKKEVSKLKESK